MPASLCFLEKPNFVGKFGETGFDVGSVDHVMFDRARSVM